MFTIIANDEGADRIINAKLLMSRLAIAVPAGAEPGGSARVECVACLAEFPPRQLRVYDPCGCAVCCDGCAGVVEAHGRCPLCLASGSGCGLRPPRPRG